MWGLATADALHDVIVFYDVGQILRSNTGRVTCLSRLSSFLEQNVWRVLDFVYVFSAACFFYVDILLTFVCVVAWVRSSMVLLPLLIVFRVLRYETQQEQQTTKSNVSSAYRAVLSLFTVTAYLRLLPMTLMHKVFGPLQLGIQSLFADVFNMLAIVIVAIIGFTVSFYNLAKEESAAFGNEATSTGGVFLDFTYNFLAGDSASEDLEQASGVTFIMGHVLKVMFLLFATVLLLNLLIAMMSNTWTKISAGIVTEWQFLVAMGVLQSSVFAPVPVPFNALFQLASIFRYCRKKKKKKKKLKSSPSTQTLDNSAQDYADRVVRKVIELYLLSKTNERDQLSATRADARRILNSSEQMLERVWLAEARILEAIGKP